MKDSFIVASEQKGERLDVFLLNLLPNLTRSHIKNLIESGQIKVNNKTVKAGEKLKTGQEVSCDFEEAVPLDAQAEDIDFEIVYEDSDLIVVNKPQGLVVHPCSSTRSGTLVNGLLYKIKDLSGINGVLRPGIVHRLDKNTSGLMVVAKNDDAHISLAQQIKNKVCKRTYVALCEGHFKDCEGRIESHIERNKTDRKKMTASNKGKLAITNYKVLQEFKSRSYVEFSLETGRTHQIRVHCKMLGHPIVGDDVYGRAEKELAGQLLHSRKIEFVHPRTNKQMSFEIGLPQYFEEYLKRQK